MFIGVRSRGRWWVAAARDRPCCASRSPASGSIGSRSSVTPRKDFTYSLPNVPWLIVPVLAWLARARPDGPMSLDRIARMVKERTS